MKSAQLGVSLLFSIFSLISPRTIDAAMLTLHPTKGILVYGDDSGSSGMQQDQNNMQPGQDSTMQSDQSSMQQTPSTPANTLPAEQSPVSSPDSGQPSDSTQNDDTPYQDQEMGGDTDSDSDSDSDSGGY